jgi:catalase
VAWLRGTTIRSGSEAALAAVETLQRRTAERRHRGRPCRTFHYKTVAAARATFVVAADVPARLRAGFAAKPGRYDAIVRFSSGQSWAQPDWVPDIRGMTVRLFGVAGDPLDADFPGVQDFLAVNGNVRFPRTAGEFAGLVSAMDRMATAPLTIPRAVPPMQAIRLGVDFAGLTARTLRDLCGQGFHGVGTIAFGEVPVRFAFEPCQPPASNKHPWRGDGLRRLVDDRLLHQSIAWTLTVQSFVDDVTTPVDDLTVRWDRRVAPPVAVGRLELRRRDPGEADAIAAEVETMAFSPWHGIAAHRPLGTLQELRRSAYADSARRRGAENGTAPALSMAAQSGGGLPP